MAVSPQSIQPVRAVHPIEARSYQILRRRADTSALPPLTRAVIERVIHASADLDYLGDVQISSEADLEKAREALASGCAVVTDAHMVAAGITSVKAICRVRDVVAA
jgi:precorrin-8X/cobalt-precorrin-8 methylmutase